MTLYRVRIDIPLIEMEVWERTEESAVDKAIATFWADTLAYVNIDPAEVEVDEVRGYPSEEEV